MDNRPERSGSKDSRGLFERFLFSLMGPPEVGHDHVREGYVADAADDLGHKCAQPWTRHDRVHTGSMTYMRCPPSQD
jgi:hypothetical protein